MPVLNVVWPPLFSLYPHDHRMWAAICIYSGREDNAFFRRRDDTIVSSGGKELLEGDVQVLGDDVIHAVHNPARSYTGQSTSTEETSSPSLGANRMPRRLRNSPTT